MVSQKLRIAYCNKLFLVIYSGANYKNYNWRVLDISYLIDMQYVMFLLLLYENATVSGIGIVPNITRF